MIRRLVFQQLVHRSRYLSSRRSLLQPPLRASCPGTSSSIRGLCTAGPPSKPPPPHATSNSNTESSSATAPESTAGNATNKLPTQQTSPNRGPVSWGGLLLMGLAGVGLLGYYQYQREQRAQQNMRKITTTGKPALGGPFVLVDHSGHAVTDASFRGQFLLLYFGFTYCPDICPNELVKVGKVVDRLLSAGVAVKPVFISVDPARDTVQQLRHYREDFHPTFAFLTGSPEQVAAVTRAYRVYFSKVDEAAEGEEYLVDHSIVVYLLSPEGEFLDFFTQRMTVADIVDRVTAHAKAHAATTTAKR